MIIKNGLLVDTVKEAVYAADMKIADGKIVEVA
jgi:N-acyl-D-aspartate/D-glutamate deacylase